MRNISAASLTKIAERHGIEPVNIVRIYWTDNGYIDYADRSFENVKGKLISLSDIEEVINLQGSGSSTSVNLTLDDSDGALKEIFNNTDMHRRPVQILQWFTDIPLTEAFVIFEGEIATPIKWNEGDRTLSIDLLSKLYDQEVGFSVEDGSFNYAPQELIGESWPLVFGTVIGIKALRIDQTPYAALGRDLGLSDIRSISLQVNEIAAKRTATLGYANYCFLAAVECYAIAEKLAGVMESDRVATGGESEIDYSNDINQYQSAGDNYLKQGNQYLAEYWNLILELQKVETDRDQKDKLRRDQIAAIGAKYWGFTNPGQFVTVNINGYDYKGYFDADQFNITEHPSPFNDNFTPAGLTSVTDGDVVQRLKTELSPTRFIYHPAGSAVLITNDWTMKYIVGLGELTVLAVYSKRYNIELPVPPQYYRTLVAEVAPGVVATFVIFNYPLSSIIDKYTRQNAGWSDEIYVAAQSPIGPNAVDIMKYLIQTYTPYSWDNTTFDYVRDKVDTYQMNFALTDRPNVMQLLTDIAYQARCAIWYKTGKFYLKFLPESSAPIETIVDSDVDVNSIEVEYTATEELITKYIAEWTAYGWQSKKNRIVFRKNIAKYGTIAQTHNYFCYNNQAGVEKAAEFWTIRKGTVWKKINFRTFLTKLRIETWDTITINLSGKIIANGPVDCIVESAKFDTASWKLVVTAWVPVRAGEMDMFPYALPAGLPIEYVYPFQGDIADPHIPVINPFTLTDHKYEPFQASSFGRNKPIGDHHDKPEDFHTTVQLDGREIVTGTPPLFPPTNFTTYNVKPPIENAVRTGTEPDSFFFGRIVKQTEDNKYKVAVQLDISKPDTKILEVEQFDIDSETPLPPDTPVIVFRKTVRNTEAGLVGVLSRAANPVKRYYKMQAPIWIKPTDTTPVSPPPPPSPPVSPPPPPPPGAPFGGESESEGGSGEEP